MKGKLDENLPASLRGVLSDYDHEVDTVIAEGLTGHPDPEVAAAAFLIADGRHMEEVKDHLGHSSIRVTSDRYGHLFPKARQAVADGLDETFRRAASGSPATKMRPKTPVLRFPNAHQGPGKGP